MTISQHVHDEGVSLTTSDVLLSTQLAVALNQFLGAAFAAYPGCIVDSQGNRTANFAGVVHAVDQGNENASPGIYRAENVASVIECIPVLDIATLQSAYAKITSAKAIVKIPRLADGTVSSDRTLGMIVANSSSVPLDDLAEELDRLPIWHCITRDDLLQYSPALADRLAMISATESQDDIVKSLLAILGKAREEPPKSAATSGNGSSGKKGEMISAANYDGPNGNRVNLFIRKSLKTRALAFWRTRMASNRRVTKHIASLSESHANAPQE